MVDCAGSQHALVREDLAGDDVPPEASESRGSAMRTAGVSAAALATAACGSEGSGGVFGIGGGSSTDGTSPLLEAEATKAQAARFVLRASLSATENDISTVENHGYEFWLDRQMDAKGAQSAKEFFEAKNFNRIDRDELYFRTWPADAMIWSQLFSGSNGVRKRIALALSEFFVVSSNGVENLIWRSQGMGAYWDALNFHAFGNYRELLEAITLMPVMGTFLNTLGNRKADAATGRVPDENFGREVMQLFSIGLYQLDLDGTVKRDGAGNPIETYTNEDVTGISKVFTGYDLDFSHTRMHPNPNGASWEIPEWDVAMRPMTADPAKWRWSRGEDYHAPEEKRFLGTVIPPNTGAKASMRMAINTLANHPNVAPFFCKQMIQRLVTSNPSPAYVSRVAQVFEADAKGKRGNLRAVFKAILLDDEALSQTSHSDPRFGKLREPMLRYVQWGRTFDLRSQSGMWEIGTTDHPVWSLSQSPLRPPSVFNFFRPGYAATNSQAAANDMVAPEFQLVNETTVAGYVNFMSQVIRGRGWHSRDVQPRYRQELAIAHDSVKLLDRLDLLLTGGQLTGASRDAILPALDSLTVTQTSSEDDKLKRIHIAVLLVMSTYDYLIQR